MSHRTAEYYFAFDDAFQRRLSMSMEAAATSIMAEANNASHPAYTTKRQALANAVLTQGSARYVPLFAQAVIAYAGSAILAAVDFAYDGHAPADGNHPTAAEIATICTAANNGVSDAQIDAATSAVWNALADILATD